MSEQLDITVPEFGVEIRIREDHKVIWVNVDGENVLRICQIPQLVIIDEKSQKTCLKDIPFKPADLLMPEAKRREAIASNTCVLSPLGCGGPAKEFCNALSRREYTISGLCQKCQDEVFGKD